MHARHGLRTAVTPENSILRVILSIKWQDMVPDTEVLTRAGIPSIHTLPQKAQVRWGGHVTRMPDDRLPKQLLYGELCYDKRSVGGQKKRFKDNLKETLTSFNIYVANWEVSAQDRTLWRSMIHTVARTTETNRIAEAQKKRAAIKARLSSITSTSAGPTYPCPEDASIIILYKNGNRHICDNYRGISLEECCMP